MKPKFLPVAVLALSLGISASLSDPAAILQKALDRPYQDLSLVIHLVKVSKTGKERPMDLSVRLKKTPGLTRTLAVFTAPPEVAGISSLSYDYTDKPAERWFKLSGMEWVKCLGNSCSNLEESFGFTMDIFALEVSEATHRLLGEEAVDGAACYKIESRAKDPGNANGVRFLTWVDKEKFVARRVESYDRNGKLALDSRFTAFKLLGTHWWEAAGASTNHATGRGLRFEMRDARINTGIADSVFAKPGLFKTQK